MKTAVVVTAIPDMKWIKTYGDMCLKIIHAYFDRYNHEVRIIDKNPLNILVNHSSWLWLLGHQIFPGYDYLLYWNLDILPNKFNEDIFDSLDMNKIAMCREVNDINKMFPHFYYNSGMVGVPKQYDQFFVDIFNRWKDNPKNWPSWEQYYVNMEIGEQKIDVHEIPLKFNMFPNYDKNLAICIHYTSSVRKEGPEPLATTAMEKHYYRLIEEGIIKQETELL